MEGEVNDKIEELAGQAYQFAADNADETGKGQLGVFAEKFAELIIRECIEIVNASKAGFSQVPAEVALDLTAKNIKAFFGVEQ